MAVVESRQRPPVGAAAVTSQSGHGSLRGAARAVGNAAGAAAGSAARLAKKVPSPATVVRAVLGTAIVPSNWATAAWDGTCLWVSHHATSAAAEAAVRAAGHTFLVELVRNSAGSGAAWVIQGTIAGPASAVLVPVAINGAGWKLPAAAAAMGWVGGNLTARAGTGAVRVVRRLWPGRRGAAAAGAPPPVPEGTAAEACLFTFETVRLGRDDVASHGDDVVSTSDSVVTVVVASDDVDGASDSDGDSGSDSGGCSDGSSYLNIVLQSEVEVEAAGDYLLVTASHAV